MNATGIKASRTRHWVIVFAVTLAVITYIDRVCISKAAPLIHEYLKHVPYGTDSHPIGTPADWTAAAAYTEAKNQRRDELIRTGMNTTVAEVRAQADVLKTIPSLVQRNLFLNGTQLENPQRTLLAKKNPFLAHFISSQHKAPTESEAEYQNFPSGAP